MDGGMMDGWMDGWTPVAGRRKGQTPRQPIAYLIVCVTVYTEC